MGNCLVTKLKGNVNIYNPEYLDVLKIHVRASTNSELNRQIYFISKENTKVWSEGGTFTTNQAPGILTYLDITANNTNVITFGAGDFNFYIAKKSSIKEFADDDTEHFYTTIKDYDLDISYLQGLNKVSFVNYNIKGNWNTVDVSNMYYIVDNTSTSMDLDKMSGFGPNLVIITKYANAPNTIVKGSILKFSACTSLERMYLENTDVEGELNDLLSAIINSARESEISIEGHTLIVSLVNTKCTEGGVPITHIINVTFDSSAPDGYTKTYID